MCRSGELKQNKKKFVQEVTRGCCNNDDIVQKLIQMRCPFPLVVFFENAELTKLMLDRGCQVDTRLCYTGKTALHLAVEYLDIDNVKVLVDHDADVNAKDVNNRMPLHRFQMQADDADEKLEILRILLQSGACLTASSSKLRHHHYLSDPGLAVLSKLLSEGDSRTLRLLVSHIDLLEKDADGKTPLHHLIKNENPDVLQVLRGKSLHMNARDLDGRTALDIAVFRGDLDKVRFLLENGANPNNLDKVGNPALRYVLIYLPESAKVRNVIELMLLYDADPQSLLRNHDNSIALGSAMDADLDFAKLLIACLAKLESFGMPLHEFVDKKIKNNSIFQDYFHSCRQQIERMKVTSVFESVTLYKLLSESIEKLTMYARNEEFQLNYELMKNSKYHVCSFYAKSLEIRVDKAIIIAKMKNKAARVVCQICRLPLSMAATIAYKIVDLLHRKDLENISKF